jgi:alkylation response protein AidB-like acyl-CoA dehydrogenase
MIEWNEQQLMIRDAVRRFVEDEIKPNLEELEHGDTPPYDILRKMLKTFGIDEMARARFTKQIAREKSGAARDTEKRGGGGDGAAMTLIPIIELCRYCPGMVTAMGVSAGLTASAIMSKGTTAQKERWALDLMTMDRSAPGP